MLIKKLQVIIIAVMVCLLAISPMFLKPIQASALKNMKFSEPENLGSQIQSVAITHASFGNEDGRDVMYTTVAAKPAIFQVIDLVSNEVLRSFPLEGTASSNTHITLPDGTVYIGGNGILYEYSPDSKSVKTIGKAASESVIYAMSHDEDGNVYFGTYPSAKAFKYDPDTEEMTDYGRMSPDQQYARSTGYYDGHLYVGIGTQGSMTKLNVETGETERIDLPTYGGAIQLAHAYSINVVSNYVIVWMGGGDDGLVFYDADKGEWSDTYFTGNKGIYIAPGSELSGTEGKIFYNKGLRLMEVNLETMTESDTGIELAASLRNTTWINMPDEDLPGYSFATVMYGGQVAYTNLETKITKVVEYPILGEPTQVQTMEKGLDGRLYMSSYPGGTGAIYSPDTRENELVKPLGQAEGMTAMGDKFYYGVYPKASIHELDMNEPLSSENPKKIFEIPGQDRPFIMKPFDDKLFIGTIPPYGHLGGALTVLEPNSDNEPKVYDHVIHNQSIVGLEFFDGKLYGSTTVAGGLDMTPTEKAAKVFVWDIENGELIEEIVPEIPDATVQPTMISGLSLGPDELLWAAADGNIFAMDPDTLEIVKSSNIYPRVINDGRWRPVHLRWGEDGLLYTTLAGQLTVIDPVTLESQTLAPTKLMTLGDDGNIYYIDESHINLMKIEVLENDGEEPEPKPDPINLYLDVPNNDFESEVVDGNIPGWTVSIRDNKTSIEVSQNQALSGNNSLRLLDQNTVGMATLISDLIEVEPGREYIAGTNFYLASVIENPATGGEFSSNRGLVQVRYYDENGKQLGDYMGLGVILEGKRGQWTQDEFSFTPHENVKYISVWLASNNPYVTDVYYDDIYVYTKVDPRITEVELLEGLDVEYGTDLTDIDLPSVVEVTLINGETMKIEVEWNNGEPAYDGHTAGTYTFNGTLKTRIDHPEGMNATIKVTVLEEELNDSIESLIEELSTTLERYIDSNEVKAPLANQLLNSLQQAEHHLNKGANQKAAEFTEKFLKHLNNKPMQKHVTENAKEDLLEKAEKVMRGWKE